MSALEKVLRLAASPEAPVLESEGAVYVRAAAQDLNELALLLASDADEDVEGEDDDDEDEDEESPGKKKPPWLGKGKGAKGKKKAKVAATQALVLEAMVMLSALDGGDSVSLSVLTQKQREQPGAHTIPGTTDYPIPDEAHLGAAVARYKEGKLAGHPASVVKKHILSAARRLGKQVELADEPPAAAVMRLAGKATVSTAAMSHGTHNGPHSHPYRSMSVVDGEHYHNNDSRHSGDMGY